jgi:ATP-dependent protease ClpP protease subunit
MTAEQAQEFGLIDKVIRSRDEAEGLTPAKPVEG